MAVLFGYHQAFEDHDPGRDHPESSARLRAVRDGVDRAGLSNEVIEFAPRPATRAELERVHPSSLIDGIDQIAATGGGAIDGDTVISASSYTAACHAAGAGLDAIERLDRGEATAAFLALRPPGHHASATRSMGFCLFNSVAVTASALLARGERVLIVDWDAHHGNGTQDIFYESNGVLFVSLHQYPLYPGTGAIADIGSGNGRGATINVPFPRGTTGDAYRLAFDALVVPAAEAFSPSWVLVSAGFDAHRRDPLTDLGLSAGDFADLTTKVCELSVPGRRIFFLEGGYDYDGLAMSAGATIAALSGDRYRPEPATGDSDSLRETVGGPASVIVAAQTIRDGIDL